MNEEFEKWQLENNYHPEFMAREIWQAAWQAATLAERERCAKIVEGRHIVGAADSPIIAPHNLWIERVAKAIREQGGE